MSQTIKRVAIIGGNRIPFVRSNTAYMGVSNQDMLTATLEGLCQRYGLADKTVGEVTGGAVMKHSKDFNLVRESLLGTSLSPATPCVDIQQACGTGLQAVNIIANKIALGQIDSGIACGSDTTSDAPIGLSEALRQVLLKVNAAKTGGERIKALLALRPWHIGITIPQNGEPRTGLSMGGHTEITAKQWQIPRDEQDKIAAASHQNLAAAYERGFFKDLMTEFAGVERDIAQGAEFAVHSWMDAYGREADDFAMHAPENRQYLDYYREMGMSAEQARSFYAFTNSVPHARALWLDASDMRRWTGRKTQRAQSPARYQQAQPAPTLTYANVTFS